MDLMSFIQGKTLLEIISQMLIKLSRSIVSPELPTNVLTNYKSSQRKGSKKTKSIESKLHNVKCIEDEEVKMWNCQVCLYIIRLEIRLNHDLVINTNNV